MWGSTFADLAKKAQELQEQASEAAQSLSTTTAATGGLFNLDAIRQAEEQEGAEKPKPPDHERPAVSSSPSSGKDGSSSLSFDRFAVSSGKAAPQTPTRSTVGKLKVPTSASRSPVTPAKSPLIVPAVKKKAPQSLVANPSLAGPGEAAQPKKDDNANNDRGQLLSDAVTPSLDADVGEGWENEDEDALDGISSSENDEEKSEVLNKDVVPSATGTQDEAEVHTDSFKADAATREPQERESLEREFPTPQPQEDIDVIDTQGKGPADEIGAVVADVEVHSNDEAVVESSEEPTTIISSRGENSFTEDAIKPSSSESTKLSESMEVSHDDADMNDGHNDPDTSERARTPSPIHMDRDSPTPEEDIALSQSAGTGRVESPESRGRSLPDAALPPDELFENFSRQMKRIEENHQAEQMEMQRQHQMELDELRASLNHDACVAAQHDLEQSFEKQLRQKDDELHELLRKNEGMKLKLDALEREVSGTQRLLEARDSDIGRANEDYLRDLRNMEKKLIESEKSVAVVKQEAQLLRAKIEEEKRGFEALNQEHLTLKARVKEVALELKERRGECRELRTHIDEKCDENDRLEKEVERLRFQLSEKDQTRTEKDEEMEQLRAQLVDVSSELEKAKKVVMEHDALAEKVLSDYKRKAQSSLALANSRAAAAIQAKEEAELEARAARSTADSAMEKAVEAEIMSKGAVAEANARIRSVESEKEEAVKNESRALAKLEEATKKTAEVSSLLKESSAENKMLKEQLKIAKTDLSEMEQRVSNLQQELELANSKSNSLRTDIATLRTQLQQTQSMAKEEAKEELKREDDMMKASVDESTIRQLQEELQEANRVIDDLKDALSNALTNPGVGNREHESFSDLHSHAEATRNNGDSSSTPLFYAMEKQAELKTAREEINRLANMLANVQSEKTEAYESMIEMRKRMEDAESRLKRFEKLANTEERTPATVPANGSSAPQQGNSGAVNIEYLKNIMLSYLNAKTLAEKRALVPVIGAVLCLTEDEQNAAIRNVEQGASIGGVGSSLFESISSKLI